MEFESLERYEKHVDKIISDILNDFIDDNRMKEIYEGVADALNESNTRVTQDDFKMIVQVSGLVTKAMSKSIVYATIESLHKINESLPNREHLVE